MKLKQTAITTWCRPCGPKPGEGGTGPPASKGSTKTTGGSANLGTRDKQSIATGHLPKTHLNIMQWNAEGIYCKKPEFHSFLKENQIDVACIQETHLNEKRKFFIRGYDTFRRDRPNGPKGGVITLVRHGIAATLTSQTQTGHLEHITIKINTQGKELYITNCYSPPTTKLDLHRIQLQTESHLIVGDFNGHSPAWGYETSDSRGDEIHDWMVDNRLVLINKPKDKPSYFSRAWRKLSTPDLAIATEDIQKRTTRLVDKQLGGSDHLPILLNITDIKTTRVNYARNASWNFQKADWQKFQSQAEDLGSVKFTTDLNQNTKKLTLHILNAAKRSIPRGFRKEYKPYWSENLEAKHQELTAAREQMEKNPSLDTTRKHNDIKKDFNDTKISEIQKCWKEKTSSLSLDNNTGKLWHLVKTLNEDATTTRGTPAIENKGSLKTGKQAANILADHFQLESTIKITQKRRIEVDNQLQSKLRKQTKQTPAMTADLTLQELNDAIHKLKLKKSPGKDGICNEMIKHLGPGARAKLLELYNLSWKTGRFPLAWKEAIIIPIPKKQKDPKQKDSYRPISLLSCLGKTLERIINKRLMWHLESNNQIIKEQSAFRKNRNTEDQLIHLTQSIENAFQKKEKVVATFIDLSKAFDRVWKKGLLLKLQNTGITGKMFDWISDFLRQRTARVKLQNKLSHVVKIREGVPQGGVISPTLFNIFINDIADNITHNINRALHADDLTIWNASESLPASSTRMQEALNKIGKWAADWGVTINSSKTVASCFSLSTHKETLQLTINNKIIPQEDTPTYLGIKLDKRLTWSTHIKETESKAIRRLAVMKKLAGTDWGANSKILKQIYTGYVRPVMEYGAATWSTASKSNTNRLNTVQNSGMRIITGGLKTTPITSLELTTKLANLEERREGKALTYHAKIQRMPTLPAHNILQARTKNRLKRNSFNHISRQLSKAHSNELPNTPDSYEPLQLTEEWNIPQHNIVFSKEVPGIDKKEGLTKNTQRSLTTDMLERTYNSTKWTHVYTDGSTDPTTQTGGSGIFIHHTNGHTTSHSVPAGIPTTNHRAELMAIREATLLIQKSTPVVSHIVILTDSRSCLEGLTSPRDHTERETLDMLKVLSLQSTLVIQWIPSHCGLFGNEEADRLARLGRDPQQQNHHISYQEAKGIIRDIYNNIWIERHNPPANDDWHLLPRHEQTIIFRLRTGHTRLLDHQYRLGLSHTPECPCGTGLQNPEHILQQCPLHKEARNEIWPQGATMHGKLWGSKPDLTRTCQFIRETRLAV